MSIAKEEARRLLDELPEDATWDEIMHQFYLRKRIEAALRQAEGANTASHEELGPENWL